MKLLLLGRDGRLGSALRETLAPLGDLVAAGRAEADLTDAAALSSLIRRVRPDVVVNAAGHTGVDAAERDPAPAFAANVEAVRVIAAEARALGAWLVHYSTDYVFDGRKAAPYVESDPTAPLNAYGRSKAESEQAAAEAGGRHLIFRTSWLYGTRGASFASSLIELARARRPLSVVDDQVGAPTSAELVAGVTALCLYRCVHDPAVAERASGIHHLTASGAATRFEYAGFVLREAHARGLLPALPDLLAVSSSHFAGLAPRPANSRLDTGKLARTFGLRLPPWEEGALRHVASMAGGQA